VVALAGACSEDDLRVAERGGRFGAAPPYAEVPAPLPMAHCQITVDGIGSIAMEEDYLPHVIQCENGGANLQALKAQAIAARSVAYYNIETSGSICDGQGCQVYSCGSDPSPMQIQAVMETSGMYLNYDGTLTYGFYVAGDSGVTPPSCVGNDGNAATEHWITYNEGKSGVDVEQTELGFIHNPGDAGYGQNRGCMGQWAARCLENDNGYDAMAILEFFYGADIVVTQAQGDCVIPMGGESGGVEGGSTGPMGTGGIDGSGGVDGTGGVDTGAITSFGEAGTDESGAVASSGLDDDEGDVGTSVDEALPDTYGDDGDAGCGCRSQAPAAAWLALLFAAPRRRRPS
jgi:MYXO-CTERM domain-containing protein